MDLSKLPSTFYRVSLKIIVLDDQGYLLVGQVGNGTYELPGGGFEHDETVEECLDRELEEELGVKIKSLGRIVCLYRNDNPRGFKSIKVALEATLENYDFKYGEITEAKFVSKDEFLNLPFSKDEKGIKDCVNKIWP